jgi:hypothetical protein
LTARETVSGPFSSFEIIVDRLSVSMPLNCSGMYRGVIRPDGVAKTAIFAEDDLEPTDY